MNFGPSPWASLPGSAMSASILHRYQLTIPLSIVWKEWSDKQSGAIRPLVKRGRNNAVSISQVSQGTVHCLELSRLSIARNIFRMYNNFVSIHQVHVISR